MALGGTTFLLRVTERMTVMTMRATMTMIARAMIRFLLMGERLRDSLFSSI